MENGRGNRVFSGADPRPRLSIQVFIGTIATKHERTRYSNAQ